VRSDDEMDYVVSLPAVLRLGRGGFECIDHDGRLLASLEPVELVAVSVFWRPLSLAEAYAAHREAVGDQALSEPDLRALVDRLLAVGFVQPSQPGSAGHLTHSRAAEVMRQAIMHRRTVEGEFALRCDEHDESERRIAEDLGAPRTKVVPVNTKWMVPPLALGMVISQAMAYEGGRLREHYAFDPGWVFDEARIDEVAASGEGIFLFSNYIWNRENLEISKRVKDANRRNIAIHGGPEAPKYPPDVETYFREHPDVDIIVHGEGEMSFAETLAALVDVLADEHRDLSVLRDVAGLSYREGDTVVRTADRERIADLDVLPSPYLTGLFDGFAGGRTKFAILETNRGCPYGCTFCDWGAATLSRIRKFDLDRVFGELEWVAKNRIESISFADANYGVFERDVAIAEKLAELKETYGYPLDVGTNYAKNTVKHLRQIVEAWTKAGLHTQGILSLQSTDPVTLKTIRRSNIKLERYGELRNEFQKSDLALATQLMMGLPGSTLPTFGNDLQSSVDKEIQPYVYPTQLLVNSPMNEPAYREENQITARPGDLVKSSATFTEDDYHEMDQLRLAFMLAERFGVFRQVTRFVRQETGMREIDILDRMRVDVRADPLRWPALGYTILAVPQMMAPPASWKFFIDDLHDYLTTVLDVADDAALESVLSVQHALLPAYGRTFPQSLDLPHDYAAWFTAMLAAKDEGHVDDWPEFVPRLRDFPPGVFTVEDNDLVCVLGLGGSLDQYEVSHNVGTVGWEFDSPVSRAKRSPAKAGV
jgi:hypothetical protein